MSKSGYSTTDNPSIITNLIEAEQEEHMQGWTGIVEFADIVKKYMLLQDF